MAVGCGKKAAERSGAIVMVSVLVPVPMAFVAESVTVDVRLIVGVPVMAPVVAFNARPAGRPAAAKLVGEPVAVIV